MTVMSYHVMTLYIKKRKKERALTELVTWTGMRLISHD
jgi:hypothetical protein